MMNKIEKTTIATGPIKKRKLSSDAGGQRSSREASLLQLLVQAADDIMDSPCSNSSHDLLTLSFPPSDLVKPRLPTSLGNSFIKLATGRDDEVRSTISRKNKRQRRATKKSMKQPLLLHHVNYSKSATLMDTILSKTSNARISLRTPSSGRPLSAHPTLAKDLSPGEIRGYRKSTKQQHNFKK